MRWIATLGILLAPLIVAAACADEESQSTVPEDQLVMVEPSPTAVPPKATPTSLRTVTPKPSVSRVESSVRAWEQGAIALAESAIRESVEGLPPENRRAVLLDLVEDLSVRPLRPDAQDAIDDIVLPWQQQQERLVSDIGLISEAWPSLRLDEKQELRRSALEGIPQGAQEPVWAFLESLFSLSPGERNAVLAHISSRPREDFARDTVAAARELLAEMSARSQPFGAYASQWCRLMDSNAQALQPLMRDPGPQTIADWRDWLTQSAMVAWELVLQLEQLQPPPSATAFHQAYMESHRQLAGRASVMADTHFDSLEQAGDAVIQFGDWWLGEEERLHSLASPELLSALQEAGCWD